MRLALNPTYQKQNEFLANISKLFSGLGVGYPMALLGLQQGIRAAHGYSHENLATMAKTLTLLNAGIDAESG